MCNPDECEMTHHLSPEFPVCLDRGWFPLPRSSSPESTTSDRPITSLTCPRRHAVRDRAMRRRQTSSGKEQSDLQWKLGAIPPVCCSTTYTESSGNANILVCGGIIKLICRVRPRADRYMQHFVCMKKSTWLPSAASPSVWTRLCRLLPPARSPNHPHAASHKHLHSLPHHVPTSLISRPLPTP